MNPNDFTERLAKLSPAKRTLLELRLQQKAAADSVRHTIPRSTTRASAPLSFAQQRLWFLNQLEPASPIYNESRAIRLRGSLDVESLQKSLDRIVVRHDVLRTNFITLDGNPQQTITDSRAVELPVIDLRSCRDIDRESEAHRLLTDVIRRPFDLLRDLLLRVLLLRLAEQEHILLFVQHHIASDGWSTSIFWRELTALYEAFTSGRHDPLSELPIQYADYALWQRDRLSGETLEGQLAYWRKQLENLAPLQLTPDRARPGADDYAGDRQTFLIPQEVIDGLRRVSRDEGVTLFMTLLAAFQTLLHRYTGQNDIAVGSPIAGRTHPEVEGLIGFFVNTLVLRTEVSGHLTFRQFLARVREVAWGAYQHQELPFEKLVAELQPDRNLGRNPLFQVIFAFQNVPRQTMALPGLQVSQVEVDSGTTKFELALFMWEEHGGLRGRVQYSTALFDADTIERLLGHFKTMLIGIVTNPDRRLCDLPLLTEREKHQILVEWNDAAIDYPKDQCIHKLFEEHAETDPDAVALIYDEQKLTYGELNQQANQLAHYLKRRGVGPETLVGLCMERSIEMIVGLLGILKAGGAYVPLDPQYPKQRLGFMLEDTQAPVLLTQQRLLNDLLEDRGVKIKDSDHRSAILDPRLKVICLDRDGEAIANESTENLSSGVSAQNLAYVIYTSGSTGKPKGVAITHHNVTRLFASTDAWFRFDRNDVWTLFHSYAFDFSVWEIWGALLHGGRLVIVPYWVSRSPELFYDLLCKRRVTVLNQTPSGFRQLIHGEQTSAQSQELALRLILFGGEALELQSLKPWFDRHGDQSPRLVNMYGITETTVHVTYRPIKARDIGERLGSPIGVRIPDLNLYILDPNRNPSPIGIPGELHIGGAGLARGYINRPELTAEKFIVNPFNSKGGALIYRTGDLARFLPDGNVEFLGRIDDQVKIRGFRIELGEIEAVLSQHPAVLETVVVARDDAPSGKRLVAYVVHRDDADISVNELRSFLKQKLPDYMIPSAFAVLDVLPLTPNGKVERKALPAPGPSRPELEQWYQAPRTPAEEMLVEIWAEVLKLESIGVHDNFFDLGGHSLLATQVISRIRGSFQVEVPLRALFESPTVAGLAGHIEEARRKEQGLQPPPSLTVSKERESLSFAQQRLWFIDQLEPQSAVYNVPGALRIRGTLDVAVLELSLNEIVRRHQALRTAFSIVEGQPVQVVSPSLRISLPVGDLTDRPATEREEEARRLAREEAQRPFDLARGPLLRVTLLRLGEQDHVLLLTMHHIVCDGWSMGVLYRELSLLYEAFSKGLPSPLSDLPIQYADFAVWQRQWLQGEVLETQLSYWKKQLEGVPAVINLPTDRPRPAVQSYRGARQSFELSEELTGALKILSRKHHVTVFMTLLAAFQTLLHRYTGQHDIVIGSPIANRNRTEIEGLIGFFVNTLVLRSDLSGNPSFTGLLARVRNVALGAYAHQDVPFEKLVEEFQPQRSLSHSPLFQVMFVLQNAPPMVREFGGLMFSSFAVGSETAKFDLTLSMREEAKGLRGSLEYSTDLFDAATIDRMIRHFERLLQGIVAGPDRHISDLPILTDAEKHQLLVEWNNTATDYPHDACIHELFEEQVKKSPDAIAVVFEDQQLTYGELNRRANQLAHYLRKLGVGPEVLVGICMERSLEMIIGLIGILKAGGAYVPLDPEYPKERLAFMMADAQVAVLLTQGGLTEDSGSWIENRHPLSSIPSTLLRTGLDPRIKAVCLDRNWDEIGQESQDNLENGTTAENLAYVIYTSGSTGTPKGVEVLHRGVTRLVFGVDYVQLDANQASLHLAPISFDASTFEIWGALLHGAKCILYPDGVPIAGELGNLIHRHKVTRLWLTASLFNALIDEAPETLSEIHQLLIGGEALSVSHVRRALVMLPHTKIINGYGPTESTTFACCCSIPKQLSEPTRSIPIGWPIGNTQVYILDGNMNPSPIGVPGEVYIGGDGLARGYLDQPELTAERFIPNPFAETPGARLYKSGDMARYLWDGNIEFLGRIDGQVKIHGYRIELEEIEAVLGKNPTVRENVVIVREDVPGDRRLVAYVVVDQEPNPSASDLHAFLKQKLPQYMTPSTFVFLSSLPLTPNGKVDRRTLPAPERMELESGSCFVAPRNDVECQLVQIYAKLLGTQNVGIKDNFFDLGGHSLLAVRAINQMEKTFGKRLPLAALFQAPTVEQLAPLLREENPLLRWSSLAPIQTKGSKFPFFWVHGEASDSLLPQYLGTDQPVYALRHQSENGSQALYTTVESIAAHYLDEIRTVQTSGPYHLGGYCFGGMVAFEIAQQLKKQGEEVALLALLEPSSPRNREFSIRLNVNGSPNNGSIGNDIRRHLRNLAALRAKDKISYFLPRSKVKIRETIVNISAPVARVAQKAICKLCLTFGYRLPPWLRSHYILTVYAKAIRIYVPKSYLGRVIIFTCEENLFALQSWDALALEGIHVHEIPGHHENVLKEPHVGVWAEKLKICLQSVNE